MSREVYEVTIDRPDDVSVSEMKEYVKVAVQSWKGGLNPESKIFMMKMKPCTVKRKWRAVR
ncbi:hypothetical protein KAR91_76725 [Candidatus Pacearchaeota archaeon]|nr:hypothetical protein [Candidatus Pacearchaeota archaeon]